MIRERRGRAAETDVARAGVRRNPTRRRFGPLASGSGRTERGRTAQAAPFFAGRFPETRRLHGHARFGVGPAARSVALVRATRMPTRAVRATRRGGDLARGTAAGKVKAAGCSRARFYTVLATMA